ncbi:hypothetical protein [uncultured Methanolobus sp.]|uniref:hypothetical protein n=1 Tax=uncultured Methanolobus sp. TaxID=218300 RepID=UPI0029C6DEA1|nr:hypothetical protein [uncultured Methanolobus sp.]
MSFPANADLFAEMNQKVPAYNQNVDEVPGIVRTLLGNEEIYGIVTLNNGDILNVKIVTKDAYVTEFSKIAASIEENKGDCNKDGQLTALDGLCALRMSVGKVSEDPDMDVDENGKVTALDAKIILQHAAGLSSDIDPTVIVTTDENTVNSMMNSETPVDVFSEAYDSGEILIEPVGFVKIVKFYLARVMMQVAKSLG